MRARFAVLWIEGGLMWGSIAATFAAPLSPSLLLIACEAAGNTGLTGSLLLLSFSAVASNVRWTVID